MEALGRLEPIPLRTVWSNEARDFTPWLAREENLSLLADVIGMELEFEAQEKDVGPFRADILCKNMDDGSWVLIENQMEKTDHQHLGQLITYASGLQAVNIVWIAEKFTEEHRSAMDWLNTITDDQFRFFALEIELWKINNSAVAPRFNFIAKPNNWSKSVSQASKHMQSEATTQTKEMQLCYWQNLVSFLKNNNSFIKSQIPRPQQWFDFSIGCRFAVIRLTIKKKEQCVGIKLHIKDSQITKIFYEKLYQDKDIIEKEIGEFIDWKKWIDENFNGIILYKQTDPYDKKNWEEQHLWLKEKLERFYTVFLKRLKNIAEYIKRESGLDPDDFDTAEADIDNL